MKTGSSTRVYLNAEQYYEIAEILHKIIDEKLDNGQVRGEAWEANECLERHRIQKNAYYEITNNGGANWDDDIECRKAFGFDLAELNLGESYRLDFDAIEKIVAPIMEHWLLKAALEQGVIEYSQVDGFYIETEAGYEKNGYDKDGYNSRGFDRNGFDKKGFDANGYNRSGFDKFGNGIFVEYGSVA